MTFEPHLPQALQSLTAVDSLVTVGIIVDNAGLKSLFVKDLFPADD